MEMIDIHTHLIPGVDDGAEDEMMALMMLLRAQDQDIHSVFVTPHSSAFDEGHEGTLEKYKQLCASAARMLPDIQLYPGCEVHCETSKMPEVVSGLEFGKYPTMNGTRLVLMEFSLWVTPENTLPCVEALVSAGYTPIIAHMERYKYLRDNIPLVDRFREAGALIQLNVSSLYDEMDDTVKNWARQLVKEKKVDFLGTDAHRTYYRPPSAQMGLTWLCQNTEQEYVDAICQGNAKMFLMQK